MTTAEMEVTGDATAPSAEPESPHEPSVASEKEMHDSPMEAGDGKDNGSIMSRDSGSIMSDNRYLSADDDIEYSHYYGGSSYADSDMASITSSLYNFVEENGRTYHGYKQGEGKYELPNDVAEQSRLDLQHQLFGLTLNGRLNLAPLPKDCKYALDIGTGTGIWAIEFALRNPDMMVIGSDLSPIQPDYVPDNCQFEISDAEDDWEYPMKLDYIHGRQTFSCFHSVPAIFAKAYDALSPGGWFEMQDVTSMTSHDGTVDGTALQEWDSKLIEAGQKLGKDWRCATKYKQYFEEAGFVDIRERVFSWPINTWPKGERNKLIGQVAHANFQEVLHAISMRTFTVAFNWTPEQVEALLKKCSAELKDRRIHAYYPVYVVYGRKPFPDEKVASEPRV